MTHEEAVDLSAQAIGHAADMVKIAWQEAAWEQQRPSILLRPRLFRDGNQYCALYGENIEEGCAGFGDSPGAAFWDFDKNWLAPLTDTGENRER